MQRTQRDEQNFDRQIRAALKEQPDLAVVSLQAVEGARLVRQLRQELGTDHGTVQRVAEQLGYGVESVRTWVRERDVSDGLAGPDAQRVRELEAENKDLNQEVRELRRANDILKRASAFFAAELDRPQK